MKQEDPMQKFGFDESNDIFLAYLFIIFIISMQRKNNRHHWKGFEKEEQRKSVIGFLFGNQW